MRILLICQNEAYNIYIQSELERSGHEVDCFYTLNKGVMAFKHVDYCAAILDIASAGTASDLFPCRVRNLHSPLLVLTDNDCPAERCRILNAGADDCMNSPVDIQELQARLYALVRRCASVTTSVIIHGSIKFDMSAREVRLRGQTVKLTRKEMRLLEIFFLNKNRLLSRGYLEDKLYSWNKDICSNVVEVHVSALRKKLGKNIICTVHGQGYLLGMT